MRDLVTLACVECRRRNYTTTKNKRRTPQRFEFKKYCRFFVSTTPTGRPDRLNARLRELRTLGDVGQ